MFYLKASLIFSAVSALPLRVLKVRQTNELVTPELVPGSCSWQCGPTVAVSSNCASGDESCVCTADAAQQLQYCLSCFVTQSSAGSLQPNASTSAMLTAVEWANDFNSQCREAGFDLPAVFVESGSAVERATGSDSGSPAVPRVGSPGNANAPASAPVATSPPTLSPSPPPPTTATPAESSSGAQTVPVPTPSPTSQPDSSGNTALPSVITLGSQTITIGSTAAPVNIPGSNASSADAAAAPANAAHPHSLRSMTDMWLAMIVGGMSVVAAVMF